MRGRRSGSAGVLYTCCLWNNRYVNPPIASSFKYTIYKLRIANAISTVQTGELPVRYNTDGTIAVMAPPKETREFNGKAYVMEESIFGDYAFVKVAKADRLGNCQFRKAQNNFNEAMGKNAKMTIVEADEIVEDGEIAPEDIHLQGIYVKRVIKSTEQKEIERKVFYKDPEEQKAEVLKGGMFNPISAHEIPSLQTTIDC